ncbi:hypothetical protein [Gulosibacter sediminis]|uniref:hypothetical protein n=1 Tax=Gulosibacter sediminis TaxID=1729695 RepID=UPI0024A97780|nr:hypothetical protein [Gulosibacter sediminis]
MFERHGEDWLECHVIPIDDLMPHAITTDCGCWPLIEFVSDTVEGNIQVTGILATHHSLDGREAKE